MGKINEYAAQTSISLFGNLATITDIVARNLERAMTILSLEYLMLPDVRHEEHQVRTMPI